LAPAGIGRSSEPVAVGSVGLKRAVAARAELVGDILVLVSDG
jgi:hypothetical protein